MFFKFLKGLFGRKDDNTKQSKSARETDKLRLSGLSGKPTKEKKEKGSGKRHAKISRTAIQTLPYERFISDFVMLVRSNVRIGKQTANLYSKTYYVPDINYSSLPATEQEQKLLSYVDLLNGFDSSASVQITLHNTKINKKDFEERILLQYKNDDEDDGANEERKEFNGILHDKLMLGQNGVQCKKYITVTVPAINFETANRRFLSYEAHLNICTQKLGTEMIPLKANERVRILTDIFRGVNVEMTHISRDEFSRRSEKLLCCPEYFEFKKDYFMYNEKFARCVYFQKLSSSVCDTIFKDIIETNQSLIITKNVEFVDTADAVELVRRQITNMNMLYCKGYLKYNTTTIRRNPAVCDTFSDYCVAGSPAERGRYEPKRKST